MARDIRDFILAQESAFSGSDNGWLKSWNRDIGGINMNWRLLGKILFVLSALPWAVFIYTLFNLHDLGLTLTDFWPLTEFVVAMLMTLVGLWLALRK
jgi:hypothetical protein